jgi:transcriptional regulator with GAF, ATPase, and Fis domain
VTTDREHDIIAAFVTLSTSLAEGFDVVDLLTGLTADCARLLDVASAGLLLADGRGALHLLAASSQETRNVELFQLQRAEGPCLDCYHTGTLVSVSDLSKETARWPQFVPAALAAGFASVHAVPMRLRDTVLGALNLFGTSVGALGADDLDLAQALAHVASVALVQDKASADKDLIVTQLNTALTSRVVIEQAKGVLAQTGQLDMEHAFSALRRYARDHNQRLSDVAAAVVGRSLGSHDVLNHASHKGVLQRPQSPEPKRT